MGPEQSFLETAIDIAEQVKKTILSNRPLADCLNSYSDCLYIKSATGVIIASNAQYDESFSGNTCPLGRYSKSYLTESVVNVSQNSDTLVLSGCDYAMFAHKGHDASGREIEFQSCKFSLLGLHSQSMALLGITRIAKVLENDSAPLPSLTDYWNKFNKLSKKDQSIAISICKGVNVTDIAAQLGVTKKTVENHRGKTLQKLELETQLELVKLLVKLQENGYGDYGL